MFNKNNVSQIQMFPNIKCVPLSNVSKDKNVTTSKLPQIKYVWKSKLSHKEVCPKICPKTECVPKEFDPQIK